MEQLNSLSFLEGAVRESLRLYAPVSGTQRIAMHAKTIYRQTWSFTEYYPVRIAIPRCGAQVVSG